MLRGFRRQALHAAALGLRSSAHRQAACSFESPLPADFAALLAALREDARGSGARAPTVGVECASTGSRRIGRRRAGVRALSTMRGGGVSAAPYAR